MLKLTATCISTLLVSSCSTTLPSKEFTFELNDKGKVQCSKGETTIKLEKEFLTYLEQTTVVNNTDYPVTFAAAIAVCQQNVWQ